MNALPALFRPRRAHVALVATVAAVALSLLSADTLRAAENRVISDVTLSTDVAEPGATVTVDITVEAFDGGNFGSTEWGVAGEATICVAHETGAEPTTASFDIAAPTESGVYTLEFRAFNGGACSALGSDAAEATLTVIAPAVIIDEGDGVSVTEGGASDTYSVVLATAPVGGDVTITATADAQTTLDETTLTFTSANWDQPQTVTVSAVDDDVAEGDHSSTITHAAAGGGYDAVVVDDVVASVADNDEGGISVSHAANLQTSESGTSVEISVVLDSEPTADVTIAVSTSDVTEGAASTSGLTFTAANWDTTQVITVTGIDDAIVDGNVVYTVDFGDAVSDDDAYDGTSVASIPVTNLDNDAQNIIVSPTTGLETDEGGDTASFTVSLTSQPIADVVINLVSNDDTEGEIISSTLLTFTPANWSTAQTVTVRGVDDDLDDGDAAYIILVTAASTDPAYSGINPSDVLIVNLDDDGPPAPADTDDDDDRVKPERAGRGGEKTNVCHVTGSGREHTINVSVNALEAHLGHGDTEGACSE